MAIFSIVHAVTKRSEAQIIEIFHLLFLRVLVAGDAGWCTLKGGANLRYFFSSPRYSNDIDLDFHDKASWMVAKKVGGSSTVESRCRSSHDRPGSNSRKCLRPMRPRRRCVGRSDSLRRNTRISSERRSSSPIETARATMSLSSPFLRRS
ncbi:MAG: hypothetical protein M5U19_07510 [Microthrixaceae bacterium]|nr:hypothetical protein [Microthrixaceae bacterium]